MTKTYEQLSATAKALQINLDQERYGTFAEIGAGQEVARHFFVAGKASQTIAKTISAYDMIYSDEIYGKEKNGRYVCESRLLKMLEKEYNLLIKRLSTPRGNKTKFFAFANTVATGSAEAFKCHGWVGVRFQQKAGGAYNDIIMHVRMMDRHRLQQQEALGAIGVNLIYSAFYKLNDPFKFLPCLVEGLKEDQIVIDVIKFSGPDLAHFNNKMMNIKLVHLGLSDAVLFGENSEILNIGDAVYGKSLLIQRGHFHPMTKTHLDVLEKGQVQLKNDLKNMKVKGQEILVMNEITLVKNDPKFDLDDYLHRIESLSLMKIPVLISQFKLFYQMKSYFRKYTQNPMGLVMGASQLEKLFDPQHYQNLEGGIFEGLGKLLDPQSKLYIYPHKNEKICLTTKSFFPKTETKHLYQHFTENKQVVDISGCDESEFYYHSAEVNELIMKKDKRWEKLVPEPVKNYIKSKKVFGY